MQAPLRKKNNFENINNLLHASAATASSWYIHVSSAMHSENKGTTRQNIYILPHEVFHTKT